MNTQEFKDLKPYQKFLVREKSSGETYRAMKESDDNAFVYAKGKRSRGYRMMADTFCTWYELLPQKDPGEAWKGRVKKVTQKLETSGLWPDLLKMFRNLMFMDYADRERIKEIERTHVWSIRCRLVLSLWHVRCKHKVNVLWKDI